MRPRSIRFAGADDVAIAADIHGDADALPVIFLHGGGQSRSAWRGAARGLAASGFQGISLDLRGHGESDWAHDGDYAFDRHVADLAAVVEALGRPAILVGASLGGHISLITASRRPDLVQALALADVTPWLDEDKADGLRAAMLRSAEGFDTVEAAAAMVDSLRGTAARDNAERLRPHMRLDEDGRFYWRWDPRFLQDEFVRHGGEGGLFARSAGELRVPVMLMHAEHSNVVTDAQVDRFRQVVPALRYERIMGVGHMVTGDDNGAYLPALLRFLGALNLSHESGMALSSSGSR